MKVKVIKINEYYIFLNIGIVINIRNSNLDGITADRKCSRCCFNDSVIPSCEMIREAIKRETTDVKVYCNKNNYIYYTFRSMADFSESILKVLKNSICNSDTCAYYQTCSREFPNTNSLCPILMFLSGLSEVDANTNVEKSVYESLKDLLDGNKD